MPQLLSPNVSCVYFALVSDIGVIWSLNLMARFLGGHAFLLRSTAYNFLL